MADEVRDDQIRRGIGVRPVYGERDGRAEERESVTDEGVRVVERERRVVYRRENEEWVRSLNELFRNVRNVSRGVVVLDSNLRSFGKTFRDVNDMLKGVTRSFREVGRSFVNTVRERLVFERRGGVELNKVIKGVVDRWKSFTKESWVVHNRITKMLVGLGREIVDEFKEVFIGGFLSPFALEFVEGRGYGRRFRRGFDDMEEFRAERRRVDVASVLREFENRLKRLNVVQKEVVDELKKLLRDRGIVSKDELRELLKQRFSLSDEVVERILNEFERVVRRRFVEEVDEVERRRSFMFGSMVLPQEAEFVQERGAKIVTDKLFVEVKREADIRGITVSGGGMGLFDMLLAYLGLRGIGRRFGAMFSRMVEVVRRWIPGLMRFARVGGIVAGVSMVVFDFINDIRKKGLKEGILSFFLGSQEKSRLSRAIVGVLKGGVIGAAVGSVVPGLGTLIGGIVGSVVGGLLHLFGEEIREVGAFIVRSVRGVGERLASLIEEMRQSLLKKITELVDWFRLFMSEIVKAVERIVDRVVEGAKSVVYKVGELASKVWEKIKQGITGIVSSLFEVGPERAFEKEKALMTVGMGRYLGPWQMTEATFREWAKRYGYAREFEGIPFLSKEFMEKWKALIRREGAEKVYKQMQEYVLETHYRPLVERLGGVGRVLEEKSAAVREMLVSTAVQYGPILGAELVAKALKGIPEEKLREMTAEEIIERVYAYKIKTAPRYFRKEDRRVVEGIQKRFEQERELLRELARKEAAERVKERQRTEMDISKREREALGRSVVDMMREEIEVQTDLMRRGFDVVRAEKVEERGKETKTIVPYWTDVERIPTAIDDVGVLLIQLGFV